MTLLEIGRTGASKQSWRSPGPRAILKRLMDDAPDPNDGKVLFVEFLDAVLPVQVRDAFETETELRTLTAIIEYWFTNNHNSMMRLDETTVAERAASRVATENKIRKAVRTHIKEQAEMLLLEWVMPNGKSIGDCTGSEVRQFGKKASPWLAKIAARVGAKQIVREVISEDDARKMWGK